MASSLLIRWIGLILSAEAVVERVLFVLVSKFYFLTATETVVAFLCTRAMGNSQHRKSNQQCVGAVGECVPMDGSLCDVDTDINDGYGDGRDR